MSWPFDSSSFCLFWKSFLMVCEPTSYLLAFLYKLQLMTQANNNNTRIRAVKLDFYFNVCIASQHFSRKMKRVLERYTGQTRQSFYPKLSHMHIMCSWIWSYLWYSCTFMQKEFVITAYHQDQYMRGIDSKLKMGNNNHKHFFEYVVFQLPNVFLFSRFKSFQREIN